MGQFANSCAGKKEIIRSSVDGDRRRRGGNYKLYMASVVFATSTSAKRDVNVLRRHLNSVQESATSQVTLNRMWAMVNGQLGKLIEQNGAGETKRQSLENQLRELRKVITEQTSCAMGTKGQAMEMGVTKIGKCVDSRNSRAAPKSESGNRVLKSERGGRVPNFGKCMREIKVRESIKFDRRQIIAKSII